MDHSSQLQPAANANGVEVKWDGPNLDIPVVDSSVLMNGQRELVIRHNGQTYRLRVTTSDKLILTK